MVPTDIFSMACRFTNEGGRILSRYGLVPPSLTMRELFAARSNSAAASAVGAYEYATGGVTLRRSF
mgnify:CR=1 FL=1